MLAEDIHPPRPADLQPPNKTQSKEGFQKGGSVWMFEAHVLSVTHWVGRCQVESEDYSMVQMLLFVYLVLLLP